MGSMREAAAISAGVGVAAAILVLNTAGPPGSWGSWIARLVRRSWVEHAELADGAGLKWLDRRTLAVLEAAAAFFGGLGAIMVTGLPVLALPGVLAGGSLARSVIGARARSRQAERQDAVLDSVRMLRQLLETGATGVNQALVILSERGPIPLRAEFRLIATRTFGRRQAWREARDRVAEPLFDMLAAAVLIQRPGGGELVPLFADLETSVAAAQEVEREARALQAQARSASTIIVSLPIVFLVILSAFHSPYLDAFHAPAGELFLVSMLAVMAGGYMWMRRLLDLPGLQRVRLTDA